MAQPIILSDIGDTTALGTQNKNLVGAINELVQDLKTKEQNIEELIDISKITYLNSVTVTLSNFKEQGVYAFGSSCTITDIPSGINGWLIVLPTNRVEPNVDIKQIWMRLGTVNSNDYMTYSRIITNNTVGKWNQYSTTLIQNKVLSLTELGFTETEFSTTDLATNFKTLISKVGSNNHWHGYVYNGSYNNLNVCLKDYLGLTIDGYGIVVDTTTNSNCSNTIYVYPNNTSDVYIFNYDNELRYGGKMATSQSATLTPLNGWTVYVGTALEVHKVANIAKIGNVRLNAGTLTQGTVLFTLPVGFRPKYLQDIPVDVDLTKKTYLRFYTNGEVKLLYTDLQTWTGLRQLYLDASYVVE